MADSETPAPKAPWDGASIASLALAGICCASPVAVGLGIAGVVRTRGGVRRGRLLAVLGIVLGVVWTVALPLALVALWAAQPDPQPLGDAAVGDCGNITTTDEGRQIDVVDCDDDHEVEVAAVGVLDAPALEAYQDDWQTFCAERVPATYRDAAVDGVVLAPLTAAEAPSDAHAGDDFVCVLRREDWTPLGD